MTVETIGYLVLALIAIAVFSVVVLSFIAPNTPNFIVQTFDKFKSWLCGRFSFIGQGLCFVTGAG